MLPVNATFDRIENKQYPPIPALEKEANSKLINIYNGRCNSRASMGR